VLDDEATGIWLTLLQAACRTIHIRVKSSAQAMRTFTHLVNSSDFVANLETALADPSTQQAKRLLSTIIDISRLSGASIPWSKLERESVMSKMFAMMQFFGPFSFFVTVAPADMVRIVIVSTYEID
jgi:hypothetical protein